MAKRLGSDLSSNGHLLQSPGLKDAPVLDLMCSHFVLSLAARQGPSFNARPGSRSVAEVLPRFRQHSRSPHV